ncbi:MAG: hypothetical protein KA100_06315 [Rickettsiales bacterium]|nr:hypothetical protein [Rickettsiales bacterium]
MSSEKVNKFYDPATHVFTFAQRATKGAVLQGEKLSDDNVRDLCTGFLTNAIYADVVEGDKNFAQGKEKALEVAAQVVVKHGEKVKDQLTQNDRKLEASSDSEVPSSSQGQLNSSEDIKKISGGTMAKIITKIAEIMASMSPEERVALVGNFSALFAVLATSFDKIPENLQKLAQEPVVIANIKNVLEGTEGKIIFDELLSKHLTSDQKQAVSDVSKEDLKTYKAEISQQRANQNSLALA